MGKVVLITGTSTGLGYSLALQLLRQGYIVYASMRNLAKAASLKGAAGDTGILRILELDVQNMESIQRCVSTIIEEQGRIDILVNNAGAGFVKTTEMSSEEEVQWVMDVNYLGVVRCSKAVLPHMRRARSGHIINISSIGGLLGSHLMSFTVQPNLQLRDIPKQWPAIFSQVLIFISLSLSRVVFIPNLQIASFYSWSRMAL
ncbi:hypothetical protein GL2_19320 [Microbulbifer sp. GL-2]|nr:SDR family NAD(P)-dependent oxidoreductase [Microbulbifer sp. GL-2]BBM01858.1 hypothetical protein GL2_19320 [Microbulbifer sp. GL-2]